jgi:membrane protein implicated in regulation of membrane protease activity
MRWEVVIWASLSVALFAAEALAPGAFMLWMGVAATVVFLLVWAFEGVTVLAQVILFVVLSFVSIQIYRTWFRKRDRQSDQPLLNRRAEQLIGRVVTLEQGIANGVGGGRR